MYALRVATEVAGVVLQAVLAGADVEPVAGMHEHASAFLTSARRRHLSLTSRDLVEAEADFNSLQLRHRSE
jgi:hypothetical protein